MPLFDYFCEAGHRFEKVVPIANRNEPIPCEGVLEQVALHDGGGAIKVPKGAACPLIAKRVEISHARPSMMLDYGLGANRDAAREGRYDPLRPSTRGVRKVQI